MAAPLPAPQRRRMTLCSFCQEPFKTLVTFDGCKHCICCTCASRIRGQVGAARHCPRCSLLPPARDTEDKGQTDGDGTGSQPAAPEPEQKCQEHQEALELFCLEDQSLICTLCTESQAHRTHTTVPVEEAAKEYKRKLEAAVELLQQQKVETRSLKSQEEKKLAEWKKKTSREREKIEKEFEKLHDFLDEEEEQLQRKLNREENSTASKLHNNVIRLAKQRQALGKLITEINERCQQPALGLLKDTESLLSRSENIQVPKLAAVSGELQDMYNIPTISIFEFLNRYKVEMTLDPKSAHPSLLLSEDGQSVSHGGTRQELPDHPERFDPYVFVLGSLRITAGRRYWEVEVGDKTEWDIGVCREAVKRKGKGPLSPQAGFWRMWLRNGDQYKVLLSHPITLSIKAKPKRVGIYLDYKGGEVSFYNVTHQTHLYTYSGAFADTLRPFFSPGLPKGRRNASPLLVCPSTEQG